PRARPPLHDHAPRRRAQPRQSHRQPRHPTHGLRLPYPLLANPVRIQVNARNRAYQFEALPGEKILYAGLRAEIDLPTECGTGTCGTCKARLVSGKIEDAWPEAPGKKSLKGKDEFLM